MKTTDAEVMKIHEELIVLDGTAGLLMWGLTPTGKVGAKAEDPSGRGFDYYTQGGFTGGAASISDCEWTWTQFELLWPSMTESSRSEAW